MEHEGIFRMWLERKPIFKNREYLRPTYTPERLPHREEQIHQLARILVAPLRGETPSNIFIYGKTGTGKTATVKYVIKELEKVGKELQRRVEGIYVNCEMVNTRYRVLATLVNCLVGGDRGARGVPMTGWPTDAVYDCFLRSLDSTERVVVIVMDEVDRLVAKNGDDVLYDLTRINSELRSTKVSVIGISNDARFTTYLDPRVKSSLGEEEIVFPPYNAIQLKDILEQRASEAFNPRVLGEGVIQLCAAHAAREHGDARRALDLLRVAGELAERDNTGMVTVEHVRRAYEKVEQDKMMELIRTLPSQSKLVLYSVLLLTEKGRNRITTGEVYEAYRRICRSGGVDVLTPRRVSDLISELDMLGVISTQLISSGRYGRTKEIVLNISPVQLRAALQEDDSISTIDVLTLPRQLTLM